MNTDNLASPESHVYIPAGADTLFTEARLNACAVDIVNRIGSEQGATIDRGWACSYYGQIGERGKQQWVWYTVRESLIDRGVMEAGRSYIPGARAKRYKLTAEWAAKPKKRYPAPADETREQREGARPVPSWAAACLHAARFDLAAACSTLMLAAGVEGDKARELSAALDFNAIGEEIERAAGTAHAAQATDRMATLWRWRVDGNAWAFRDPSGHRLHTPITNLHRPLRAHLDFGALASSPALVEIDARNSQVVFLAAIAVRELGTADARAFAAVCYSGRFYEESFAAVYGREPSAAERDAWKAKVMGAWLYAEAHVQKNSKEGQAIGALWPNVHTWILERKRAGGVAALPCDMQRTEAGLWIDRLVPALEAARVPVFTIHDCAIVPADATDTALTIVRGLYSADGMEAQFSVAPIHA